MIQCSKCGAPNETGSGFCAKCGNPVMGNPAVSPGNKKNLKTILIVIGLVIGLCVLCGVIGGLNEKFRFLDSDKANKQSPPAANSTPVPAAATPEPVKAAVNIPAIWNKSPEEVEKLVGRHLKITPITGSPDQMPGEYRNYDLPGMDDALNLRFYKGKVAHITVNIPDDSQLKSDVDTAKMVGLDVSDKPVKNPIKQTSIWTGNFGEATNLKITTTSGNRTAYFVITAEQNK